jgi:hypothetical protein
MPREYLFVVDGARDLLRRKGFTGATRHPQWQRTEAVRLLEDAAGLMAEYGVLVEERAPAGSLPRVWSFAKVGRRRQLWVAVSDEGGWQAWLVDPEERVRAVEGFHLDVTFDHVTRDILGPVFERASGGPLREFGADAIVKRLTPLEGIVGGILGSMAALDR